MRSVVNPVRNDAELVQKTVEEWCLRTVRLVCDRVEKALLVLPLDFDFRAIRAEWISKVPYHL